VDVFLPLATHQHPTQIDHVSVGFETPIVYQFPMQLPTDLLSVIIQAKYVISKLKLS